MVVVLHGKTLEPSLIKRSIADAPTSNPPSHGMRVRQPAEKRGQLAIFLGPNHEVPMVGHDAIGQNSKRMALASLDHDALERFVIEVIAEQLNPPDSPIENVINQSARCNSRFS